MVPPNTGGLPRHRGECGRGHPATAYALMLQVPRISDAPRQAFQIVARKYALVLRANDFVVTRAESALLRNADAASGIVSCPLWAVSSTDQRNTYLRPRTWSGGDVSSGWIYGGAER